MRKKQAVHFSDEQYDDMFIDDDKGTGQQTDNAVLRSIRNKYPRTEEGMKEKIHSLEQEVIKLQLQNMHLSTKARDLG